ncbi:MAG: hypothetical protein RIG82_12290 [Phycisphaeraceae bacterium]
MNSKSLPSDAVGSHRQDNSQLLTLLIAAAAAVAGFRLAQFLLDVLDLLITLDYLPWYLWYVFGYGIHTTAAALFAVGVSFGILRLLRDRSGKFRVGAFVLVALLAANPIALEFEADYSLMPVSPSSTWAEPQEILPIDLEIRLVDGFDIGEEAILTHRDVLDASPTQNRLGGPAVSLMLTEASGDRLHELTSANIGKRTGVWIDGELMWSSEIYTSINRTMALGWVMTEEEVDLLIARIETTNAQ